MRNCQSRSCQYKSLVQIICETVISGPNVFLRLFFGVSFHPVFLDEAKKAKRRSNAIHHRRFLTAFELRAERLPYICQIAFTLLCMGSLILCYFAANYPSSSFTILSFLLQVLKRGAQVAAPTLQILLTKLWSYAIGPLMSIFSPLLIYTARPYIQIAKGLYNGLHSLLDGDLLPTIFHGLPFHLRRSCIAL